MNIKDLYRSRKDATGFKGSLLRFAIWWYQNVVPPHPHPGSGLKERYFNLYCRGKGDILLLGENSPPQNFKFGGNPVTQLDIKSLPYVDIVADAEHMSEILNQKYDYIVSVSMLEHTPHPWKVVAEMYSALRPGGIAYISVPWMFPLHGEPHDYHRFTVKALQTMALDNAFEILESGSEHSPHSALYWFLRFYFSEVFSFNNRYIYYALLYIFTWLLFPVGLIERMFKLRPREFNICDSQVYIVVKKPS